MSAQDQNTPDQPRDTPAASAPTVGALLAAGAAARTLSTPPPAPEKNRPTRDAA